MSVSKDDLSDLIRGDREVIYIGENDFRINHHREKSFSDFLKLFGVNHYTPEIGVVKSGNKFDYFFLSRRGPNGSGSEENLNFLSNHMEEFKSLIHESVEGVEFLQSTYDLKKPSPFGEIASANSKKAALQIIEEEKSGLYSDKTFFRARLGGKHYVCVCVPEDVNRVSTAFEKFGVDYDVIE